MKGPYTIIADRLYDGTAGLPIAPVALTVAAGRIVSLATRGRRWTHSPHPVHDFSGCTIIPGLIDPHCHLALQPHLDAEASIAFARDGSESTVVDVMRLNAGRAFASGVTCLRDCGSPGGTAVAFRAVAEGSIDGLPRVFVSGRPITTAKGHCYWMGVLADTEEQICGAVRSLADEGVDFIKVMATGGMMTSSSNPYAAQYSMGALTTLVHEAHGRSKRVAAHALSSEGVRNAISAQVDTLEHFVTTTAARQDYDASLNAEIAGAGIIVGVTAHAPLRQLLRAGDASAIRTRLAPHRELRAAGVTLTVHSDAGTPGTLFDGLAESVEIFQIGLGTSLSEALQAATQNAALALGIENHVGVLAAGRAADYLVLDGDLASDIHALRRVVRVNRGDVVEPCI